MTRRAWPHSTITIEMASLGTTWHATSGKIITTNLFQDKMSNSTSIYFPCVNCQVKEVRQAGIKYWQQKTDTRILTSMGHPNFFTSMSMYFSSDFDINVPTQVPTSLPSSI